MKRKLHTFAVIFLSLLTFSQQFLGCKYVFSASGPKTFDCSGFVRYCFLESENIELPHSAKQIGYSEYQTIESISELKEGDIVCFNTVSDSDKSDHVGIYLGDGDFIHASSRKGEVVISTLLDGVYNKNFTWGKRVI